MKNVVELKELFDSLNMVVKGFPEVKEAYKSLKCIDVNTMGINELYNKIGELKKIAENEVKNAENPQLCELVGSYNGKWSFCGMAPTKKEIEENHEKYKQFLFDYTDVIDLIDFIENLYFSGDSQEKAECTFNYEFYILANKTAIIANSDEYCESNQVDIIDEKGILRDYIAVGFWVEKDEKSSEYIYLYLSIKDLHEIAEKFNIEKYKNITFEEIYKDIKSSTDIVPCECRYVPNGNSFFEEEKEQLARVRIPKNSN